MKAKRTLILAVQNLDPVVAELCAVAAGKTQFEVVTIPQSAEVSDWVERKRNVVIIRAIRGTEELKEEVHFIRDYKTGIENNRVIFVALNWINHPQVHTILKKMGFFSVISVSPHRPETCGSRVLGVLEEALKLLDANQAMMSMGATALGEAHSARIALHENRLELQAPLEISQNCWLLRHPEDVKIFRGHWLVDLVGPGPLSGKWIVHSRSERSSKDAHALWEWHPKPGVPASLQTGMKGVWQFWGRRPYFENYHWKFISKAPKFTFSDLQGAESHFFYVSSDERLLMSSNAQTAIQKWPDLYATILADLHIKVEAPVIDTLRILFASPPAAAPSDWRDIVGLKEADEKYQFQKRAEIMKGIEQRIVPRPEVFNVLSDAELLDRYLVEVKERKSAILVWTEKQLIRFETEVAAVNLAKREFVVDVPAYVSPKAFKGKVFFSVSCLRGGVFFSVPTEGLRWEGRRMLIQLTGEIYEVQRRGQFRMSLSESFGLFVRAADQFFVVNSLGAGGLGFVADARQEENFYKGMMLEDISFELNSAEIHCHAEVRWKKVKEASTGDGSEELWVGVQFSGLHLNDRQRIQAYVMEANFENLAKFVL